MDHQDAITKVAEIMKGANICVMSTIDNGKVVSRPMGLQSVDFDGDLWFFTYDESNKVREINANPSVNVALENKNSWVSLSGNAELVQDRAKIEELWSTTLKPWFPNGIDEPGIALIKVNADTAEYWDASNSKVVTLLGLVKTTVTGKQAEGGENKTVDL